MDRIEPTSSDLTRVMDAHLALIGTDVERWLSLLADDAVVEFPYAPALGASSRLEGIEAIRSYFVPITKRFQGLAFTDVRRYPTTDPDVGWMEVHGTATLLPGHVHYEQDYVMRLHLREGRIVRYAEYWNPMAVPSTFVKEQA